MSNHSNYDFAVSRAGKPVGTSTSCFISLGTENSKDGPPLFLSALEGLKDNFTSQIAVQMSTDAFVERALDAAASPNEQTELPLLLGLGGDGAAIFAEICPVDESRLTGRLGAGCRLLTLIDSSRPVRFDLSRISKFYQLSPSEADILGLIAEGHGNQEIAERRDRSPDTIKTQIKGLMRKTNSENRMDLVHMVRNLSSPVRYQAQR